MNIDEETGGELPTFEDGPNEDVEIELTEDDLDGIEIEEEAEAEPEPEPEPEAEAEEGVEAEAEAEEEPEEKPRKRDPQRRIAELAKRAQEAERRAQEIESQLQQEAALRRQSDIAMMTHYENNLKTQAAITRSELQAAKAVGDSEKEIDLQTQLFQIQTSLSEVDSWKKSQQQEPERQPVQEQPQVRLEQRTQDWITRNDWFQPQSPAFDQEMHEEATIYARRIERRYRSEGRADEIGGVEYFAEIDRHMSTEFPDAFAERSVPKKATPKMSRNSPVAPVARTGVPGQPAKASKVVKLSAEQRKLAHSLAASGAIKGKGGARLTPQEAERVYAIQMMNNRR
jgi:hypothetical protein